MLWLLISVFIAGLIIAVVVIDWWLCLLALRVVIVVCFTCLVCGVVCLVCLFVLPVWAGLFASCYAVLLFGGFVGGLR